MNILKDAALQNFLDENGYVVLNLLSHPEVAVYVSDYEKLKQDLRFLNGVQISFEHPSSEVRSRISKQLIQKIQSNLNAVMQRYKLFQGSFISKAPATGNSAIPMHQDWTFVAEQNGFESYTLWIALCDITKEMGTVGVVPQSHKHLHQTRYSPNEKYVARYNLNEFSQGKEIGIFELNAGQALLWNHKLIHFSTPNVSDKERLNMTFGITGSDAPLKLFWLSPLTDKILEFDVPDDFYYRNNSAVLSAYYNSKTNPENMTPVRSHDK